jgi:hypothetical protein
VELLHHTGFGIGVLGVGVIRAVISRMLNAELGHDRVAVAAPLKHT